MEILNKSVKSFNFADIVSFCHQSVSEGTQIEYKKEFPRKSLAKSIAALANTRGGVIIIGVEEDQTTGLPKAWDGLDDAKWEDQAYQHIANVEPLPSYEVHKTIAQNNKVFVLIRIYEGDKPPYYAQNDSNIWVRTGNIRNPIDIASPDGVELMFGKREKAEKARDMLLRRANEIFQGRLEISEKEKKLQPPQSVASGSGSSCYCHVTVTALQ